MATGAVLPGDGDDHRGVLDRSRATLVCWAGPWGEERWWGARNRRTNTRIHWFDLQFVGFGEEQGGAHHLFDQMSQPILNSNFWKWFPPLTSYILIMICGAMMGFFDKCIIAHFVIQISKERNKILNFEFWKIDFEEGRDTRAKWRWSSCHPTDFWFNRKY